MARTKRTAATFAWRLLKSDIKLLAYPIIHVVLMIVLLWSMWSMIFDISAMELASSAEDAAMMHEESSSETDSTAYQREHDRESSDINNIFGHIHFGWLFVFLIINALIGVLSVGGLTAQALTIARGERKSLAYGYSMALARLPQLLMWGVITIVIGTILTVIEQNRALGLIVGAILGLVWSVLTFFSITAIMATGCGPFGAISTSKNTIVDTWKKATGSEPKSLRTLKRGLYVGGPFLVINIILTILLVGFIFVDMRGLTGGGHGISAGAVGTLIIVLFINHAFMSAMWAIVKATVYVWAEEDRIPEGVDASELHPAFVGGKPLQSA